MGLPQLASRLEEEAHWNRMLSLGEQQRLGLARALLHAPQYLFLDEATASLDEASEAALYRLLEEKLPATTIVSIGHRATLEAFHQRNVVLTRDGDRFALQDRAATAASASAGQAGASGASIGKREHGRSTGAQEAWRHQQRMIPPADERAGDTSQTQPTAAAPRLGPSARSDVARCRRSGRGCAGSSGDR